MSIESFVAYPYSVLCEWVYWRKSPVRVIVGQVREMRKGAQVMQGCGLVGELHLTWVKPIRHHSHKFSA